MMTTEPEVAATRPFGASTTRRGPCRGRDRHRGGDRRRIAEELRIRRDMRELRAMDDCMLKDIGLTRADIGSAVRYGRD